ncbi:MAG TPA: cytochrome c oxidase subunit 2A [Sphingomicrobium sp.]|nr:cytochrome c oxidase subunit 2A [Sphingomicrobium sp.]
MTEPGYPTSRHDYADDAEEIDRLEKAMDATPTGAIAVSLIAVTLLLIGWFGMYFLVFLPRGTVG